MDEAWLQHGDVGVVSRLQVQLHQHLGGHRPVSFTAAAVSGRSAWLFDFRRVFLAVAGA